MTQKKDKKIDLDNNLSLRKIIFSVYLPCCRLSTYTGDKQVRCMASPSRSLALVADVSHWGRKCGAPYRLRGSCILEETSHGKVVSCTCSVLPSATGKIKFDFKIFGTLRNF